MKHALFIAFHYPPEASSSGVLRTLKYTRYLLDKGWRSTVLTLRRDAYEYTDEELEKQIPEYVKVIRTNFLNTKWHLSVRGRYPSLLAVPDRWIGWLPWAVSAGRRVFREDPFDLIFSTSPHPTAHLIARSLARWSNRPWVADFRDPWYEEPPEPGTPAVNHWTDRYLERRVIRRADRIVASTPRLRDVLAARYPDLSEDKFHAVLNGYDEMDFASLDSINKLSAGNLKLILLHAGNINLEYRDPRPLFRALARAGAASDIELDRIQLRFLGPGPYAQAEPLAQALSETGLTEQVLFEDRVPYNQVLRELGEADILILLQASEDTRDLVPAKLYEYLRAGRPVLALVRPGAIGEIMTEVGGGWLVDPAEEQSLSEALVNIYRMWKEERLHEIAADQQALQHYSRQAQANRLAGLFYELIGE